MIYVPCAPELAKVEPTGVGDAFRAGFLTGIAWGLPSDRAAEIGSMLATYVIETVGTQEYDFSASAFLERFAAAYGDEAAADIASQLPGR